MSTDAETYRELRTTVVALARSRPDELEVLAPAAPEWRVRDVVSHVAGVCDDVVHGNLKGLATDSWTEAQVEKRRDWTVEEILADWEENGRALDAVINEAPVGTFGQLLYDTWTHEQDVRGALAEPGGRDSRAAERSCEWGLEVFDLRDRGEDRRPLAIVTADGGRVVGDGEPVTTVRTTRFELLRAMTGRRSSAQMRAYTWDGEPDPDRLVLGPIFHPRADDLVE